MAKKTIDQYTDEQLDKAQLTAQKGKSAILGLMIVYVIVLILLAVKGLFTILIPLMTIFIVLITSYLNMQRSLKEIDVEKKRRGI